MYDQLKGPATPLVPIYEEEVMLAEGIVDQRQEGN